MLWEREIVRILLDDELYNLVKHFFSFLDVLEGFAGLAALPGLHLEDYLRVLVEIWREIEEVLWIVRILYHQKCEESVGFFVIFQQKIIDSQKNSDTNVLTFRWVLAAVAWENRQRSRPLSSDVLNQSFVIEDYWLVSVGFLAPWENLLGVVVPIPLGEEYSSDDRCINVALIFLLFKDRVAILGWFLEVFFCGSANIEQSYFDPKHLFASEGQSGHRRFWLSIAKQSYRHKRWNFSGCLALRAPSRFHFPWPEFPLWHNRPYQPDSISGLWFCGLRQSPYRKARALTGRSQVCTRFWQVWDKGLKNFISISVNCTLEKWVGIY